MTRLAPLRTRTASSPPALFMHVWRGLFAPCYVCQEGCKLLLVLPPSIALELTICFVIRPLCLLSFLAEGTLKSKFPAVQLPCVVVLPKASLQRSVYAKCCVVYDMRLEGGCGHDALHAPNWCYRAVPWLSRGVRSRFSCPEIHRASILHHCSFPVIRASGA